MGLSCGTPTNTKTPKTLKSVAMATVVPIYPEKTNQLWILLGYTYPENSVKIHAWVKTVEHPQL